jgi:hypothetical protein
MDGGTPPTHDYDCDILILHSIDRSNAPSRHSAGSTRDGMASFVDHQIADSSKFKSSSIHIKSSFHVVPVVVDPHT